MGLPFWGHRSTYYTTQSTAREDVNSVFGSVSSVTCCLSLLSSVYLIPPHCNIRYFCLHPASQVVRSPKARIILFLLVEPLHSFPRAAVTKHHRLVASDNRKLFSHGSGSPRSTVKVLAGPCFVRASRGRPHGLQPASGSPRHS